MKTSVEIDQEKVNRAKDLAKVSTLKELIDKALDALIREKQRGQLADMLGTNFFEGDLDKLRERNAS